MEDYLEEVLLSIAFASLSVGKKLNPVVQFSKVAEDQ